jgi:hypothetical protein
LAREADEFVEHLASPGSNVVGERAIVGWYLAKGLRFGLHRIELEAALATRPRLQAVAASLSENEIAQGKSPPQLLVGQSVEVVVNAKNITYHRGTIREVIWHHNERAWHYYLEANGKKIGKRYAVSDLRACDA